MEPLESMLRPFNLVIPFTMQKGELTGRPARGQGCVEWKEGWSGAFGDTVRERGVHLHHWVCLTGEVRMPSGKTARPNITDNKDGTITVRYAPTEKGLHQMGIKYDGNHIPGEGTQTASGED